MSSIDVQITDESEIHCVKLILQPRNSDQPLEIYLHATQAIDLVHKLSLSICELHRRHSAMLLKHKYGIEITQPRVDDVLQE